MYSKDQTPKPLFDRNSNQSSSSPTITVQTLGQGASTGGKFGPSMDNSPLFRGISSYQKERGKIGSRQNEEGNNQLKEMIAAKLRSG